MSALQQFRCTSQLTPDGPFKRKRRKLTALRPAPATSNEAAAATTNQDQLLVQQAIAGNSEAQERLFATHTPKLYRIAFNVLRNKEDAEDAVQDGWCRAYIKLHTFQARSSLSTWLARIIINSALMIRRRNKHVQISLGPASEGPRTLVRDLVDNRPTPEQACWDGEMNGLLVEQTHGLPSAIRAAVLLREVDELTIEESTKLLGIKKSAMKSRTRRARQKLAQRMLPLLHIDRQRRPFLISQNSCGANYAAATNPSSGEVTNDQL
jgi:RNA polymerase sigma-70 factor (ECF subfamily)